MTGKVFLVGAGPGDPDLLTLKAVKALRLADVILTDDLVSAEVLAHARPGARILAVGKRGGCRSTPQEFIERLMIAAARKGLAVVRLKGGDPMIFGRGGEECEALRAAGIEHEVVNGITSGLAAATAIGIPLTHRALCHGAILVTGHERAGERTDWAALVRTGLPLVIYMGVARVDALREALLAAGMPAEMPAAVVANASRPEEKSLATTLGRMAIEIRQADIASPAILIVGEVARLAAIERVAPVLPSPAPAPRRATRGSAAAR
jgi:uroporphyrin-III C-methyltransferase